VTCVEPNRVLEQFERVSAPSQIPNPTPHDSGMAMIRA